MVRFVSPGADERSQDGDVGVTKETRFREGLLHERALMRLGPDTTPPTGKALGDTQATLHNW